MHWTVWRVVLEKIATLHEIDTHWSIYDLADANDVLDYRDAINDKEYESIKSSSKGKR